MMDSGTTFKFRGYSSKRSGAAVSSLFLDYDDDDDDDRIYDLDGSKSQELLGDSAERENFFSAPIGSAGRGAQSPEKLAHYDSPGDLCRVADTDEIASVAADSTATDSANTFDGSGETSACFDVPDAALSSCVWVGSGLLSRMLFQIYNEMGDESKTNTWYIRKPM